MEHITITGSLGSGKSVVSAILKEKLGMEIESVGSLLRKMAQHHGMSTNEFNKYIEAHPEFDYELDSFVQQQGSRPIPMIFDSRLAWHFIPQSFKVYLYVKDEIAARRVYGDKNRVNEKYESEADAQSLIIERRKSEILRFKTQYDIDIEDLTNYNLVIDTSHSTPEAIADMIIDNYRKNALNQYDIWISPYTPFPTKEVEIQSLGHVKELCASFATVDDYVTNQVCVIHDSNRFFIVDGHKRVLNAMIKKINLIPCLLVNPATEPHLLNGQSVNDYIQTHFSQENYSDWNDVVADLTDHIK